MDQDILYAGPTTAGCSVQTQWIVPFVRGHSEMLIPLMLQVDIDLIFRIGEALGKEQIYIEI